MEAGHCRADGGRGQGDRQPADTADADPGHGRPARSPVHRVQPGDLGRAGYGRRRLHLPDRLDGTEGDRAHAGGAGATEDRLCVAAEQAGRAQGCPHSVGVPGVGQPAAQDHLVAKGEFFKMFFFFFRIFCLEKS